ncbi:MAG: hypothetical protein U1E65_22505 [Myxococcota bacterium]
MLELSKHILQALYETTGQTGTPVDIVGTLRRRWPAVSPDDVHAHLNSLAARGLVLVRSDGAGVITTRGVEALAQLWRQGAFGVQGQQQAIALAADAAMREAPPTESTQPYSIEEYRQVARETATARAPSIPPPPPPPAPSDSASDIEIDIDFDSTAAAPARGKSAVEEWSTARPGPSMPTPQMPASARREVVPALALNVQAPPATPAPAPSVAPPRPAPPSAPFAPPSAPAAPPSAPAAARAAASPSAEPRARAPLSWPPPPQAPVAAPLSSRPVDAPRSSVPAPNSWGSVASSIPSAVPSSVPSTARPLTRQVALNDLDSENRLNRLRAEIDGLTQALSAATTLPMEEWTAAIELTSELERTAESLTEVLSRAIGKGDQNGD